MSFGLLKHRDPFRGIMNLVLTFVFGPREPVGEAPLSKQSLLGQAVWLFQRQQDTSQGNGTYTDPHLFFPLSASFHCTTHREEETLRAGCMEPATQMPSHPSAQWVSFQVHAI